MEILNFKLSNKELIKVQIIRDNRNKFVARCPLFFILLKIGNIQIDDLFFKFSHKEQTAIIYHELWHKDNNLNEIKRMLSKKLWLVFYERPIYYSQEYKADIQGAKLGGKKNMLSTLKKLKGMIRKGILKGHEKNHPPIDERIKRIKNLKI